MERICGKDASYHKEKSSDLTLDKLIPFEWILNEENQVKDEGKDVLEKVLVNGHFIEIELFILDYQTRIVTLNSPEKGSD